MEMGKRGREREGREREGVGSERGHKNERNMLNVEQETFANSCDLSKFDWVKVKICSSIFTIGKAHQALFKFQRLSRKSRLKCKSKQLIVWPNRAFAHQITLFVSNWQNSYNYLSVKVSATTTTMCFLMWMFAFSIRPCFTSWTRTWWITRSGIPLHWIPTTLVIP